MRVLLAACAFTALAATPAEPPRREGAARLMQELMSGKAIGGDFTLTDARGRRVSLEDFRGKLVLLYFGFATCPDVCPTDLQAIGRAVRALGPDGDRVQPVFVTLDPARDTREVIGAYAAAFHPRFVALTGSEAAIRRVADSYKVFYEKVAVPGALGYTIDHAAFTYVIDANGQYVGIYPPGTPSDRMELLLREELGLARR